MHIAYSVLKNARNAAPRVAQANVVAMDELLAIEPSYRNQGLEAGRAEGVVVGYAEGHQTGQLHGAAVGSQLGWQVASAEVLAAAGLAKAPKAAAAAQALHRAASSFPQHNSPDHDAAGSLQRVAAQYKVLTSLARVPQLATPDKTAASF